MVVVVVVARSGPGIVVPESTGPLRSRGWPDRSAVPDGFPVLAVPVRPLVGPGSVVAPGVVDREPGGSRVIDTVAGAGIPRPPVVGGSDRGLASHAAIRNAAHSSAEQDNRNRGRRSRAPSWPP